IADDRHVDLLEMDAASRTGVGDIREILDGVRYRPTSARAKIYIIDEVHMLSTAAFNALLKTLEEPPEHVKFIFATTEIRKVPVTVLSRCQRFDLRRVDADILATHFAEIAEKEGATIADEALKLISRAADGSVRDGLSLLDQAISHGHGAVSAEQVRDMLGLADRGLIFDLFEATLKGQAADALDLLARQYAMGADPATIIADLLDLSHWLTRIRIVPTSADDPTMPETERVRGKAMAGVLSMASLTRTWQILLKGLDEVRIAPSPLHAAEMVLIRLMYAQDLPTPGDAIKTLAASRANPVAPAAASSNATSASGGAPSGMAMAVGGSAAPQPMPTMAAPQNVPTASATILPATFEALVGFLAEQREALLAATLHQDVRLISYEPGTIVFHPAPDLSRDFSRRLGQVLESLTQRHWTITASADESGAPTLRQQEEEAERRREAEAARDPLVCAVIEAFPGASITRVQMTQALAPEPTDTDADWPNGENDA
ncbi:MAG: DNA polymerase III subunit gamma/tau, partial [Rhodospirillaceae bacterium]|nr:DNA polymerase III subunit gamma/tau [Rhodospirillaceae bacterium]